MNYLMLKRAAVGLLLASAVATRVLASTHPSTITEPTESSSTLDESLSLTLPEDVIRIITEGTENEIIKLYAKQDFDVNANIITQKEVPTIIETPAHLAARRNQLAVLHHLKQQGADLTAPIQAGPLFKGDTPLIAAIYEKHLEIVKFLHDNGVNIDAPITSGLNLGTTPIWIACASGSLDIVKYLHTQGADITAELKDGDHKGVSPLFVACQAHNADIVKYLISQRMDINKPITSGLTPFAKACELDNKDAAQLLYELGADIHKPLTAGTYAGYTPLAIACKNGGEDMVKYLIDKGVDYTTSLPGIGTPLEIARKNMNFNLTRYVEPLSPTDKENILKKSLVIILDSRKNGTEEWQKAKQGQLYSMTGLLHTSIKENCPVITSRWLLHDLYLLGESQLKNYNEQTVEQAIVNASARNPDTLKAFISIQKLKREWSVFVNSTEDLCLLLPNPIASQTDYGFEGLSHLEPNALIDWIKIEPTETEFINVDHLKAFFPHKAPFKRRIFLSGHGLTNYAVALLTVDDFINFVQHLNKQEQAEILIVGSCYTGGTNKLKLQHTLLDECNKFSATISLSALEKKHMDLVATIGKQQQLLQAKRNKIDKSTLNAPEQAIKTALCEDICGEDLLTDKSTLNDLEQAIKKLTLEQQQIENELKQPQSVSEEKNLARITFPIVIRGTLDTPTVPKRIQNYIYYMFRNLDIYFSVKKISDKERLYTLTEALRPLCVTETAPYPCEIQNLPIIRFPGANSYFRVLYELDKNILPLTYTSLQASHFTTTTKKKVERMGQATIQIPSNITTILVYPTNCSSLTMRLSTTPRFISALSGTSQHRIHAIINSENIDIMELIDKLFLQPTTKDIWGNIDPIYYESSPKLWGVDIVECAGNKIAENLMVYTKQNNAMVHYALNGIHYVLQAKDSRTNESTTAITLPLNTQENVTFVKEDCPIWRELHTLLTVPSADALYEATAGHETLSDVSNLFEPYY